VISPQEVEDRLKNRRLIFLKNSGIPPLFFKVFAEYGDATLERYKAVISLHAVEYLKSFIDDYKIGVDAGSFTEENFARHEKLGVYIFGKSGAGKTVLAAWILYQYIQEYSATYGPAYFFNVPELLDNLRPGSDSDKSDLITKAKESPLVVLDDLGVEVLSPWVFERLYNLINHRYSHLLPFIITSNLPLKDLTTRLSEKDEVGASRLLMRITQSSIPWPL